MFNKLIKKGKVNGHGEDMQTSRIKKKNQHFLGIRINIDDFEKLRLLSKEEDRTISATVRRLIKRKIYNWERQNETGQVDQPKIKKF